MSETELRRQSRYTWMLIAFTAIFVVLMARPSRAALANWDGDNVSGNFSYNNNWYNDVQPSWGFGNQLQFNYRNNIGQTSIYWDYGTGTTWYNIDNITFMNTFGAPTTWNGNGGGLNFNDKIENQSNYTITFGTMNFSGGKNGATSIELNPVNGDMVFSGGNLYNDNSLGYKVWGNNQKMLTLGTALGVGTNAAKVGLSIEQYSKVYITAAQNYQSNTAIKVGELWLGTGGSINANSKIDLGLADTNVAKLYLTGTANDSHAINVLNAGGTKVLGGLSSSGTNTFSGNVTNNSGGVWLENTVAGGTVAFTGVLSGTGNVTIGGSGRVLLSGTNNSFTGNLNINNGATLAVQQWGTNTISTVGVSSTGTHSSSTTATTTSSSWMIINGGTVQYVGAGETFGGGITIGTLGATVDASGTGLLNLNKPAGGILLSGDQTTSRTLTLTGTNTANNQMNWNLTNGSGGAVVTLNKTGTGTWRISGSSTFSGGVDIRQGTIVVGASGELASYGSGSIRIYDGATFKNTGTTPRGTVTNALSLGGTNNLDQLVFGAGATLTNDTVINITLTNNTGVEFATTAIGESGGARSLRKTGVGTLTLSGSNSYSGGTILSTGNIYVTNNGTLGSSSSVVSVGGGTLDLGGTTRTNATYNVSGGAIQNGSISVSSGFNYGGSGTFTGVNLSGVGYFSLTNGTFTLDDRINGLTGGVRLTGGTLTLTNAANLGSGNFVLGSAGALGALQVNNTLTATNAFVVNDSSTNTSINVASSQTFTMSGTISQTNGNNNLTKFGKDGAGTLVMAGSNGTYGGQLQIGDGSVIVGVNNALGTNTTTANRGVDLGLNVGDTAMSNNVSLLISNGVTFGQSIYVATNSGSATRTIGLSGTSANGSFTNEIYQDGNLTLNAGSSTGTLTVSGAIVTNTAGVAKGLIITNGTTVLANTNNTFTGGITIGSGATLSGSLFGYATNTNAALTTVLGLGTSTFKDANKLTIDGGTLKYTGSGETDYLYFKVGTNGATFESGGSGAWVNSGGSGAFVVTGDTNALRTITLSGTNANTNMLTAKITNGSSIGLTKVVKTGTGVWELGSSVSDYSGGTELRQGTIIIGGSSESFGTGEFQMYDGTTLSSSSTTVRTNKNNNNFKLGGGLTMSWLEFSNTTLTNNTTITVLGTNSSRASSLTFAGNGVAELGGSRSLTLSAGQGAADTNTWATFSGVNSFSGGLTLGTGMSVRLVGNGTLGANSGAVNLGNGTIDLGGLSVTNGAVTLSSGILTNGTMNASSISLTNAGTITASLVGSGAVSKSGPGTSILSGANTYSGGTTISSGSLQGDTTSLQGAITNHAILSINQSGVGTYGGPLSGSGNLNLDGNGSAVVTLSGNNSFSGLTSLNSGTLKLGSSTALGSGGSDWTTTGTKLGTGAILDLNGQNIANEALAMNSSTAYVTNSSSTTAVWGGAISMTNGTNQFNVAAGKDITLNGSIVYGTASRQLMKNGDGVLTVAGTANTNQGAININAGTLRMGNATALGGNTVTNDVTVASGATLDVNGYTATASIKPIKLSGNGVGGNGALQNSASGTTATVNNAVVLNGDASIGGQGNMTLANSVSGASTLTKVGVGTLAFGSGARASVSTIAVQQGTLLLGAANQISESSAVTLAGGTLDTSGFADRAGQLTVNSNSSISGLVASSGAGVASSSDFLFSSVDLSSYGTSTGGASLNLGGGYAYGATINFASTQASVANGWTGYTTTSLNNFANKIQFGNSGMKAQINFNGGTGAAALTYVTAIPEPKVYVAIAMLVALVGLTEYRRRRQRAVRAV